MSEFIEEDEVPYYRMQVLFLKQTITRLKEEVREIRKQTFLEAAEIAENHWDGFGNGPVYEICEELRSMAEEEKK